VIIPFFVVFGWETISGDTDQHRSIRDNLTPIKFTDELIPPSSMAHEREGRSPSMLGPHRCRQRPPSASPTHQSQACTTAIESCGRPLLPAESHYQSSPPVGVRAVTLGLCSHKDLSVDPWRAPHNVSMVDLKCFLMWQYALLREHAIHTEEWRPRMLVVMHRSRRWFVNLDEIVAPAN
jgi:hypothetical protein